MFRISLVDLVTEGQTWHEIADLAQELVGVGVDVLNTGIGWHESRVPTILAQVPRGVWAHWTQRLKRAVPGTLVCASNRINTPELADALIADGTADLVSMARPLLADPDFVIKAAADRADEINTCIACNQACLDHIFVNKRASCLVNPQAARETELVLAPTRTKRQIAVVGAGPAGLAAATTAAERGHDVTLFEAREELGGQFRLAMAVPGKEEFAETLRYFTRRLEVLGVATTFGHAATVADLGGFDHVVVATGVSPRRPSITGIDHDKVLTYPQVLRGEVTAGERVAVIGAGGIGVDMSVFLTHTEETDVEWLAHWGVTTDPKVRGGITDKTPRSPTRHVYLLQRKTTSIGKGLGKTSGWAHKAVMRDAGVTMITGATYERIDDEGLHITMTADDQPATARVLDVDHVVICAGQESVRTLADDLAAAGLDFTVIGGADVASELDTKRAIKQATEVAAAL